jgi:hypothetical protein
MGITDIHSFIRTKDISDTHLLEIVELRKMHYYDSAFDERYWNGGVYNINDIDVMKGNVDESSKYALILNEANSVVAYSRYSTAYKTNGEYIISKLHIIKNKLSKVSL